MKYLVKQNQIIILDKQHFNPQHILECGQIFSYVKQNSQYIVYSGEHMATIKENKNNYVITTNNTEYFVNFFDLNTSYETIKNDLKKQNQILQKAINFGYGIRILNQDIFETIISFIVSANNNIKRIQKILFTMRNKYGTNMGGYNAFPTLEQLKKASEQDFKQMGAGYRAKYLYETIKMLQNKEYLNWKNLKAKDLAKKLTALSGVGPKVADCIMLFAYGKKDVFPVDTWIHKVYNTYFGNQNNRNKIRENLINKFGMLSGYAQQYLFYAQRSLIN